MKKNCVVVGHRGFRSLYPENTRISFQKAVEIGVDAIEFDIHPTKDRQIVVAHDATVDRCSNGTGLIHDMTLSELRKLDFGIKKDPSFAGTQILTLEETLDCIYSLNPEMYLLLEIKEDDDECTKQALDICKKYNVFRNGLLLSFVVPQLQLVKRLDPTITLQGFPYRYLANPPAKTYSLYNKTCIWTNEATNAEIQDFHDQGIAVDICAVDNEQQFQKALSLDCDSITTNCPEVILPMMRENR